MSASPWATFDDLPKHPLRSVFVLPSTPVCATKLTRANYAMAGFTPIDRPSHITKGRALDNPYLAKVNQNDPRLRPQFAIHPFTLPVSCDPFAAWVRSGAAIE